MSIIKSVYSSLIRPHLPRKIATHAGVAVRKPRLLDSTDCIPDHTKRDLVELSRDAVERGDDAVVIGGGEGVAPAAIATAAGPTSQVDIYEASADHIPVLTETMRLNAVSDRTTIHHAVVGDALEVAGEMGEPDVIAPKDLPTSDILQLDCEGAEIGILESLDSWPSKILVETHPKNDAPTDKVTELLSEADYEIVQSKPDPVAGDILYGKRE